MNRLSKFNQFNLLRESSEPNYDRDLHRLLITLFLNECTEWLNDNTYLECYHQDSNIYNIINDLKTAINARLRYEVADHIQIEALTRKVLSGIQFLTNDVYTIGPEVSQSQTSQKWIAQMPIYSIGVGFFDVSIVNDFCLRGSFPKSTQEAPYWYSRIDFEGFRFKLKKKDYSIDISYFELIEAYSPEEKKFALLTVSRFAKKIKRNLILYWVNVIVANDGKESKRKFFDYSDDNLIPHPAIQADGSISLELLGSNPDELSIRLLVNESFLNDILITLQSEGLFLPIIASIYIILYCHDLRVPTTLFSESTMRAIELQPKLLSLCRQHRPDLFSLIVSKRSETDRWKTGLTTDMGDLGF